MHRIQRPGLALVAVAALAVSGCELAVHGYEKAGSEACVTPAAGCPLVVDAAGDGPVQARPGAEERAAIVAAAEAATVRQCGAVPLLCQAGTIGDVIVDQYVAQF